MKGPRPTQPPARNEPQPANEISGEFGRRLESRHPAMLPCISRVPCCLYCQGCKTPESCPREPFEVKSRNPLWPRASLGVGRGSASLPRHCIEQRLSGPRAAQASLVASWAHRAAYFEQRRPLWPSASRSPSSVDKVPWRPTSARTDGEAVLPVFAQYVSRLFAALNRTVNELVLKPKSFAREGRRQESGTCRCERDRVVDDACGHATPSGHDSFVPTPQTCNQLAGRKHRLSMTYSVLTPPSPGGSGIRAASNHKSQQDGRAACLFCLRDNI